MMAIVRTDRHARWVVPLASALALACRSGSRSGGRETPPTFLGPDTCLPVACADVDPGTCGALPDGCGGTLDCACAAPAPASRCDPPSTEFCSDDGFCWLNPLPQGDDLAGLWGATPDRLWAAGPSGAVLRWDGTRWLRVALPRRAFADAIWGIADDDVWAVGSAILHWDGRCWTDVEAPVPAGGLVAVHGTGPGDVWAAGGRAVLHHDGTSWRAVDPPADLPAAITALWVAAPGRPLVGAAGWVFAWDGAQWTRTFLGPSGNAPVRAIAQLWGTSPSDLWAATSVQPPTCHDPSCPRAWQALFRWDGAAWSATGPLLGVPELHAVAGSAPADVWAFARDAAWHWDGAGWTSHPLPARAADGTPTPVRAARIDAGGRGWAAGAAGGVLRLAAGEWSLVAGQGTIDRLTFATGTSARDVWIGAVDVRPPAQGAPSADRVVVLHWDGQSFSQVPAGFDGILYDAVAVAPGELWANTYEGGLWHLRGGVGSAGALGTTATPGGVLGFGPEDLWWIGPSWLNGAWTAAPLWHWAGGTPAAVALPAGGWERLSGTSGRDLWVTGSGCDACGAPGELPTNHVLRWDGAAWTVRGIPGGAARASRAWSDGRGGAWVVGSPGLVVRIEPDGASRLPAFGDGAVERIVGAAPGDLWAFGEGGLALHHDGQRWTRAASGTRQSLLGAYRAPEGDLLVAGSAGAVLRRAPR